MLLCLAWLLLPPVSPTFCAHEGEATPANWLQRHVGAQLTLYGAEMSHLS